MQRKIGDDFDIGANASAEEGGEGTEEATESGVDLVLNHRLVETGFGKKADYMNYLKDYMKRVVAYLESNNKADQVDSFKKNINGVMKSLLGKFSDLQFYTGRQVVILIFVKPNGISVSRREHGSQGNDHPGGLQGV